MQTHKQTVWYPIPLSSQTRTTTASAANATALDKNAKAVRLWATQDCYVELDGTATTSSMFLPASQMQYLSLPEGGSTGVVISALRSTADGILYITPLT